jgi:methylenetetrahydrofolate reductase (NADPH)
LAHCAVFDPEAPLFDVARRFYSAVESASPRTRKILHVAEHVSKLPLYNCKDCGDCSLPEIAYLCPESQCAKNQRNGPCGGSHDGICEVAERECIWARAYERLKPYGEETSMLDGPAVFNDYALRGTSAWANTFLGRDHTARQEDVH